MQQKSDELFDIPWVFIAFVSDIEAEVIAELEDEAALLQDEQVDILDGELKF